MNEWMDQWMDGWRGAGVERGGGMDGSIYEHQCQQQLDDPGELGEEEGCIDK